MRSGVRNFVHPRGPRDRRIGIVHLHVLLMLSATVLIWLFVGIVVAVTLLLRRGRLGSPERQVGFRAYGPVLAAACSAGAAGVHLEVVGEHALQTGATASTSGFALLCSIGAGSTQFTTADATIAGFLPLGVATLVVIGLQALLAVPAAWRNPMLAVTGLVVSGVSIVLGLAPKLLGASQARGATQLETVGYADALALVLEVALAIVVSLLVLGRPKGLFERLQVKVADAYVGTGLAVAAVAVFTVTSVFAGHSIH
jgi:hypothetical protein